MLIEVNLEHTKRARFGKSGTERLRDQVSTPAFDWPMDRREVR